MIDPGRIPLRRGARGSVAPLADNRVLLLFATDLPLPSRDGRTQRLVMTDEACDLGALTQGAPLLVDHLRDVDSVVGVVESAWVQQDSGYRGAYAVARFSRQERAQRLLRDVEDGILTVVSVGFHIRESRDCGEIEEVTAWRPYEISLVAFGADPVPRPVVGHSQDDLAVMSARARSEVRRRSLEAARARVQEHMWLAWAEEDAAPLLAARLGVDPARTASLLRESVVGHVQRLLSDRGGSGDSSSPAVAASAFTGSAGA